ncbi:proline--tRNA ligase [Halalkalibacterium halodurans]|jgi:prolyl-tRNA synthetase|uniref:proline--tRNA ligase n=1 Tax=Halalkalibacterium halodurans TaxID=86665 RepID=UPI0010FDD2F3|nr:proline--tRNA ligase [Halalkalibacterium halodurans]MED3646204.1 proline--tRNA ligase [Halalkalibacterium halodurans]MED4164397.1 proline--tRNA ligase [Halalkalibacterium halodurans]
MKQSFFLVPTMREVPADADVVSHQLMLRAGMIRQVAAGIYTYLPLARRVIRKIESIVREELDQTGAQEITMPTLHPAELWQESGRWEKYGDELMRLTDRHNRQFALGPTHEEVITSLIRDSINSYKKLPLNVYQIQSKFRDERRPRFGLLRGREFIMKDAYSFHTGGESLDEMYKVMYDAYSRIFRRAGLNVRPVIADSGAIGGKDTHEFMALADVGEDTIAYSDQSDYAANIEMAAVKVNYTRPDEPLLERELVDTGDAKTIRAVAERLSVQEEKIIKSLLVSIDDEWALILLRGDHELNDIKLKHALGASDIRLATEEEVLEVIGTEVGTIGPVDVKGVKVIADHGIKSIVNGVCGANESNKHFIHVNEGRDFTVDTYADLRFIQEGDPSPDGKGTIRFAQGIEVGQVFKLGTVYSEKLGATFLDENGKSQPMLMGCYGIGVSRMVAAVIEQHHDEDGIVWPTSVAPFDVHVLALNVKKEEQMKLADSVYHSLQQAGLDVLLDDRPERAGVKFKDADLIGLPLRVAVGKRADEGYVEVKVRKTGEVIEVHADELVPTIQAKLQQLAE